MFNKFYSGMFSTRAIAFVFFTVIILLFTIGCSNSKKIAASTTVHAFRLKPGQLLKEAIQQYVNENHIQAGWMGTCVGSLTHYQIRLANQPGLAADSGHFEIVSLVGTVSEKGSHLHISLSDSTGKTIGGHLADKCKIYTTAEIVIMQSTQHAFTREKDGSTPWEELQVKKLH